MTTILRTLDAADQGYNVLFCDLWGCLHNGREVFPAAVKALEEFRTRGGTVVLLTNSPRPSAQVAIQLAGLGAPESCYDLIVSSGDAAQQSMAAGAFGRRVYHIGPERDLPFFADSDGTPLDVERTVLEEAEGIVCTGLFDDHTETPDDYRAQILYGVNKGLKLLCANPDIIVDVGEQRIFCAGAIAKAYSDAGGESFYFGKPHSPIYALARAKLEAAAGIGEGDQDILCVGDGIATDIAGAMGEELDAMFISGGLAAQMTGTTRDSGPDQEKLDRYLADSGFSPKYTMAWLR